MNIVNKLTLRHLKENMGRTVVTTMGICVSVAMITAVFVALASFLNLFADIELISSGNVYAKFKVNQTQYQALEKDDRIDKIGFEEISENGSFYLEESKTPATGTGDFLFGDSTYINQMVTGDYEGILPLKAGEIAVEQKLLARNNLDWKIGDIVVIPTGSRYITVENGEKLTVNGKYKSEEKFVGSNAEYKITAILHNNPATRFTPILACSVDKDNAFLSASELNAAVTLKKVNYKSLDVIKEIIKSNKIEEYDINEDFLEMHFAFSRNNKVVYSFISITAIILLIIVLASVVLIYNAFAMSISERIRYLGMLASVGATKRQKRLSVYFESLVLGLFGIPIGIVSGIAGISITLKIIGGKIISTGMIQGISDSNMEMKVIVPIWVIIGIVFVSGLTIFISTFIPSKKASKITPIDAIKQSNEFKVKTKKLRSSRIVRWIFGYEGELANKNLKRNGRKARVITASIAISVILFISCNYFCSLFTQSIDAESELPYQINVVIKYDDYEKLSKYLEENSDIERFYSSKNYTTQIDKDFVSKMELAKPENLNGPYRNLFKNGAIISNNILDDEVFNELCKQNNIDYKKYYGDKNLTLLMNNVSHKKSSANVFTDEIIGANFSGIFDSVSDDMTVGDLIEYDEKQVACNLNPNGRISIYQPVSQYIKLHKETVEKYGYYYNLGIETQMHTEVAEEISEFLSTNGFANYSLIDNLDSFQVMNTLVFVIKVLAYGFITLITFITIFNIINTISTGVYMRKKEFAMFKSVGITPSGFNKMIMLESAFYGINALVFSLPASALISYGMYRAFDVEGTIAFEINYLLYVAVVTAVMAIIGMTMLYSVRKLRNDSIIETLKEEIN